MSQHCNFNACQIHVFYNFNILTIPVRAMEYLDYRVVLVFLCSRRLPENCTPVTKYVGIVKYIVISASVGRCIYCNNMPGVSNKIASDF